MSRDKYWIMGVGIFLLACWGGDAFHKHRMLRDTQNCVRDLQALALQDLHGKLLSHFYIFDCYDLSQKPLQLKRMGRQFDGGYVVPLKAFQKADALMGYGIADDISFEESFSDTFQKPSYGFDGGAASPKIKNPLCRFVPECLGTNAFLYKGQKATQTASSFSEQLERFQLKDKKVFLKVDIEGAEYEVFADILSHAPNITGLVLEIHSLEKAAFVRKAIHLLEEIEKNFVLVHIHGNNCSPHRWRSFQVKSGELSSIMELTYINKNLLSGHSLSLQQKHPTPLDMPNVSKKREVEFELLKP